MSGYFQRLLARSAQPRAEIHPLARLPQFGLPQTDTHGDTAEFAAAAQLPEQACPRQPHPQQSRREQPQLFTASGEQSEREAMPAGQATQIELPPAPLASAATSAETSA